MAIATLNAIPVSLIQLKTAMERVAWLPPYGPNRDLAGRAALDQFSADEGIGAAGIFSAAVHARIAALEAFCETASDHSHTPSDLAAAAAVAQLVETVDGPRFEAASFCELVAFSAQMPF